MERYIQLDPLGVAFAASLRGIKHFQEFLPVYLKVLIPFPTPIKGKDISIGPLGSCFRSIPLGDKTFSKFQKSLSPSVNLKHPPPFPTPIKWKEYQLDPLGAAFAASLRGIKHFQVFKKAPYVRGF